MNNRNKSQNDIMFNLVVEFGIHGINNGYKMLAYINALLSDFGDQIRLVGCNVKKPTARIDLTTLLKKEAVEDLTLKVNDDESLSEEDVVTDSDDESSEEEVTSVEGGANND